MKCLRSLVYVMSIGMLLATSPMEDNEDNSKRATILVPVTVIIDGPLSNVLPKRVAYLNSRCPAWRIKYLRTLGIISHGQRNLEVH